MGPRHNDDNKSSHYHLYKSKLEDRYYDKQSRSRSNSRSHKGMYRPEWNADRGPTPNYPRTPSSSYYQHNQYRQEYPSPPRSYCHDPRVSNPGNYTSPPGYYQRQDERRHEYQARYLQRDCGNSDYRQRDRNPKVFFKDRRGQFSRSRSRSRSPPRCRTSEPYSRHTRSPDYVTVCNGSKWDVRKSNANRPDDYRGYHNYHEERKHKYSGEKDAEVRKRPKFDNREDSLIREQVQTQKRLADRLGEPTNNKENSNQKFEKTNLESSDQVPSTSDTRRHSDSREPTRDKELDDGSNRIRKYSQNETGDASNFPETSHDLSNNEQNYERVSNLAARLGPETKIKEEPASFYDENAKAHQDERKPFENKIKEESIDFTADFWEDPMDSKHDFFGKKDLQKDKNGKKLGSSNCADTSFGIDDRMNPRVVMTNLNLHVQKPGFEYEVTNEENSNNSMDQPSTSNQNDFVKSKFDQTQNLLMNQVTENKKDVLKNEKMLQLKSIILLIQSKYESQNEISLVSEVKKPEDLNDAIFCFKNKNPPTNNCSLYSVKYIVSESRPNEDHKIGLRTLASPSINIRELFGSYRYLKEKISSQNGTIENFAVHTNLELDELNFKKSNIEVITSSRSNAFKLKVDEKKKLFRNLQESYATLVTLSKLIAEYMDGKDHYLCGLMEKYQVALMKEQVIVVTVKKEVKNKIFGKFHKNFINDQDLSPSAKLLRSHLESILKKPITQDIELNIPQNFGDVFPVSQEPQLAKVEDLAKKLATAAQSSLEEGKTASIKNHPNLRDDLQKIADHVLKKSGKALVFTDNFLNENFQLPGNLKGLRNLIFHLLQVRLDREDFKLIDLKKCKFSIKKYNYISTDQIKNKLPELNDKENVRDFFDKLEFIVEKSIVDDRIREIFPDLAGMDEKTAMVVQEDLLKWFTLQDPTSYPFYELKSRQSKNLLFSLYEKPETDVEFKNETLNEFKSTLNLKEGRKMLKISTNNIEWTKLKLLQSFSNTPQNSKNNHHLFINFNVFSKITDNTPAVISAFSSPETALLVIERDEHDVDVNAISICGQLKKVMKKASHKPSLIIMGKLDKFPGIFQKDCEKIEDSVRGFKDLTDKSVQTLYENVEVALHGRKLKIKHLMTFEFFQNIASSVDYFLELWNSTYRVDVKSPVPVAFPKKCFIQRTLKKCFSEVEYDENSDERIIVISADSGCGKSSFVYWLHKKFGVDLRFPRWSVNINLTNVDFHHNEIQFFEDVTSAALFITSLKEYAGLRKDLFIMSATGEINIKLVLFFDGFEELDPKYANVVLNLLKVLKNSSIEKIFITSSPKTKSLLETELDTTSYYLQCFSREEKIQFLQKYWSNEMGMDEHDKNLHSYAEYFLKFYSEKEVDLTSTPLFIKMLAEINKMKLKFVPSKYEVVPISNFYCLFKRTYDKILKPHLKKEDILGLQKVSLESLMTLSDYNALAQVGKLSASRVVYVSHTTYAEFFAAMYFSKKSLEKISYFIDKILRNSSPVFFNCIVNLFDLTNSETFIKLVCFLIDSSYNYFLNCLLEYKNDNNQSLEIELFHTAIEKNSLSIVRRLLDRNTKCASIASIVKNREFKDPEFLNSNLFNLINSVVNEKNAFDAAVASKNLEIVCELLLHGYSLENSNKNLLKKFILHVASEFSNDNSVMNQKFHAIMETLFTSKVVPEVIENLKERGQLFPIYHYFFTVGPITIIEDFIDLEFKGFINIEDSIEYHQGMSLLKSLQEGCITHEKYRLKLLKLVHRMTKQTDDAFWRVILDEALKNGHQTIFKKFIGQYSRKYSGYLKWCMCLNDTELIELLFKFHKNYLCSGKTILHFAVTVDLKPKTLDFIIDKQGNINCRNNEKETPLCVAIKSGAGLPIIKHLVKRKASINAIDSNHMYPWCYVIIEDESKYCKEDQIKIMDYFLNGREEIKEPMPKGQSSEPYDTWKQEVKKKLEYFRNPNYDINIDSNTGDPRLHNTIKSKSKVDQIWARFLITYGADVNIKNSEEKSALHLAIELKEFKLAKTILRYGATFNEFVAAEKDTLKLLLEESERKDVDDTDRAYFISLLKKAKELFNKENFAKVLNSLLSDSKDATNEKLMHDILHCRNRVGYSLLHIAAFSNNESSINALLDFSVQCRRRYVNFPALSVDVIDRQGNTPLHIAASKGFKKVILTLLAKNACFEPKNVNGKTPLDLARNKGHNEIVELLDGINFLFKMIKADDEEKVKEYLNRIPSALNAKDKEGKTPAHHAAKLKNRAILEILVSMKSSRINATDFSMKTPLHYAIKEDNIESVKLLLSKNIIIDCSDNKNRRPFDLDIKNESAELVSLIYRLFEDVSSDEPLIFVDENPNILLDYLTSLHTAYNIEIKDFVSVRDYKRNNLMHYAVKYNYDESVLTLVRSGVIFDAPNESGIRPVDFANKHEKLLKTLDGLFSKDISLEELEKVEYDKNMLQGCRKYGFESLSIYAIDQEVNSLLEWLYI